MSQVFPQIILGFLIGAKHAFEADHIIAVSNIVTSYKNPLKAALIGAFWGIGHTTTLFVLGLAVLVFKISIPNNVSLIFELIVSIMLTLLGIKTLYGSFNVQHVHLHKHNNLIHVHAHDHQSSNHDHQHKKSFFIGAIHGLAGSGALMLIVLSTISETINGLYYILLFGLGSIGGMTTISFLLGLPYLISEKKFPKTSIYLNLIVGFSGVLLGIFLMYQIIKVIRF